jgi:NADPH:quinone reductase-like Zn-dependent oxidoreductase
VFDGTSGVGSAAIQICRDLGAEVIATAGNDDKCEYSKMINVNTVKIWEHIMS